MVLVSAIAHVVIPGILNYLFLPLHILYFVISFASTKKNLLVLVPGQIG